MLRVIFLFILFLTSSCTDDGREVTEDKSKEIKHATKEVKSSSTLKSSNSNINYELLLQKVTYGKASFSEVRQSLTDKDIGRITNSIHALYSLRWHRGVINLLDDMWALDKTRYPELSWNLFDKPPVKLAIASTINRIKIFNTEEYKNYLYEHKYDDHEFHRAQVIIALAFNADPKDVEYLQEMADGDNHYVTQTAVTGLALMGGEKAKATLGVLWKKHKGTPRGDLIEEVLNNAYKETPTLEKQTPEISANN